MSSYLWWAAQQVARQTSTWVATHPAESSLIGVGLANPATRGFTKDVLKSVAWRTTQMTGRITMDIGKSMAARSTVVRTSTNYLSRFGQFLARNPVATIVAIDIAAATTAIALAQDEDPATESTQVRSTGFSFGGLGTWGIGTGGSGLVS